MREDFSMSNVHFPLTRRTDNYVVIMASNHPSLAILYPHLKCFEQVTWGVHKLNPALLCLLSCVCHGVFMLHWVVREILAHALAWGM